ncbi:MAG: hypothetical protein AABW67_03550 [Nanoarchaeota archaeon]
MEEKLLQKVKANKKYKTISDEIVLREINNYLKSHLSSRKNKEITEQDIKNIRKNLHRVYSSYQTSKKNKKEKYLEELDTEKLLSLTLSTKERLNYYEQIYQKIFEITGKPKIIVDLGCGLNPLSIPLMNLKNINYFAYDIDEEDKNFLNKYFEVMKSRGLNGKAEILDINNKQKLASIPSSDIIFLFKVLDLIDNKKTNKNELIKFLLTKTKFLVVSFATATLTGRKMQLTIRTGFEEFLKRNNFQFQTIRIPNELFYIIKG